MSDSDLPKTLERLAGQLARELEAWEHRTRSDRQRVLTQVSNKLSSALDRVERRETRREAKRRRKLERRAERRAAARESASTARALFDFVVAAVLVAYAVMNPLYWWLIFVALGFGSGAVRQLTLVSERTRLEAPAPALQTTLPAHTAPHEVDGLCDQLLADLRASPEPVRAFLAHPEKTIEALRQTAKSLDARRRQLEAEDAKARLGALHTQRSTLNERIASMTDAEAKRKLESALRSLDGQEAAISALSAAYERIDGEYTSLIISLQELKTRVAVARSTSSSDELGALKASVGRLNTELEAITDSLQATHSAAVALSPVDEGAAGESGASSTERDRVK